MASIERTAYPRLKRSYTEKELERVYTPTADEARLIYSIARGTKNLLNAMILLKTSQRLGFSPSWKRYPSQSSITFGPLR